ncbi:RlpA-like protein precursor [compost metagenome]
MKIQWLVLILVFVVQGCAHKLSVGGTQVGTASWYGETHHGRTTANGEKFNMNALTAAHRKLPMNSTVRVKSLTTGKSVTVRINDRGPYSGGRIIDVSKEAARQLGFLQKGTDRVEIEVLSTPVR